MFIRKTPVDPAVQACQATIADLQNRLVAERQSLARLESAQRLEESQVDSAERLKSLLERPISFPAYINTIKACRDRKISGLKEAKTHVDALVGKVARGDRSSFQELLGLLDVEERDEPLPCGCTFCTTARSAAETAERPERGSGPAEMEDPEYGYCDDCGDRFLDPTFDDEGDTYCDDCRKRRQAEVDANLARAAAQQAIWANRRPE